MTARNATTMLLFVVLFNLQATGYAEVGGSVNSVDKSIAASEGLWSAGKTTDYFVVTAGISDEIYKHSGDNRFNGVAVSLLENILSKDSKFEHTPIGIASPRGQLVSCLLSNSDITVDERKHNAKVLAIYLGSIRKQVIPVKGKKNTVTKVTATVGYGNSDENRETVLKSVERQHLLSDLNSIEVYCSHVKLEG